MIVSLLLTLSLTAAFSFAAEDNIIPESDASTMLEKIDGAVVFLEEKQESMMMLLSDGTYYSKEVYPLDNGGVLTMNCADNKNYNLSQKGVQYMKNNVIGNDCYYARIAIKGRIGTGDNRLKGVWSPDNSSGI